MSTSPSPSPSSSLSSLSLSSPSPRPHLPFAAAALAPILSALLLPPLGVDLHVACSLALASLLAFTASALWLRVLRSVWSTLFPVRLPSLPPASAIALARLPQEEGAMAETLKALGTLKYGGPLEVVLAFSMDPLSSVGREAEAELLASLAAKIPCHVSVCHVSESASEEEMLQSALELATGQNVAVFHAGHCPRPEAMAVAAQWSGKQGHVSHVQERMDGRGRTWESLEIGVELPAGSARSSTNQRFLQSLCQLADGGEGWYGAFWRFVPWAVVQMVPLVVFLLMGQMESPDGLSGLSSSSTSRIATSLVLSSSY